MESTDDAHTITHQAFLSRGMWNVVTGVFYFSLMGLGVRVVGRRLASQEIVLVRGALNLVFTYVLLRRARVRPWGSRPRVLILRGLLGFGSLSCLYYAIVHLPLADATVLQFTNPVWTAVLAVWLLGERMNRREVLLSLASLGGVVLIARPSFLFGAGAARLDLLAVGVALAGALFNAGAFVTVRNLSRTEHTLVIIFYFTLITVPGAIPGALMHARWPTPIEWVMLFGIGVAAQLGQIYMTRGLELEPAGRAAATGYLQVAFAAAWGVIFLSEIPDAWAIVGALVILASTLAIARENRRAQRVRVT